MQLYRNTSLFIIPYSDIVQKDNESDFARDPLAFLTETLLATEEHWTSLPGVTPLFLREALEGLLEVT
jgi:hypothetical protein